MTAFVFSLAISCFITESAAIFVLASLLSLPLIPFQAFEGTRSTKLLVQIRGPCGGLGANLPIKVHAKLLLFAETALERGSTVVSAQIKVYGLMADVGIFPRCVTGDY